MNRKKQKVCRVKYRSSRSVGNERNDETYVRCKGSAKKWGGNS